MADRQCVTCGQNFWQGVGRPSNYCPRHRPDSSRYGARHQRRRAAGKRLAWGQPCTRCGHVLIEGQEIHLDHADGGGPDDYLGWAHAYCNTTAPHRGPGVAAAGYAVPAELPSYPHHEDCRCRAAYAQVGSWGSRCW